METRVKVVYDDRCPTCTVGMHIAQRLDPSTIDFIGMNTDEGHHLITEHSLDMSQSAYLIDNGRIASHAAFMREVFGTSLLGTCISLPFRIPYVGTVLYKLFALHRSHITKSGNNR